MGRFNANEADNYGSSSKTNYFRLVNDMDVAKVRFMYNDMNDVVGYAVHEVEVDGKKRYVNCIREYKDPKSKCPLCAADNFQRAKLYIPVYDIESGEVKIWERGKNFFAKISALCARYTNADTPLCAHTFDIERHGKAGETTTTYEIFETGCDDTRLEDLPEIPDVMGSIILDKNAEEMEFFIAEGYFPNNDGAPKRESVEDRPSGRRTPTSSGRRSSEVF